MFRLVLCLFLASTTAQAGPWLREHRGQFRADAIEFPLSANAVADSYASIYYEWGATPRLTLGADIGLTPRGGGKTILFARTNLWRGQRARMAVELGAGHQSTALASGYALRPGISWGRGMELMGRHGWLAVDLSYTYLPGSRHAIAKLETTAGLNWSPRLMLILQASAERESGDDPFYTLTPSVAMAVKDRTHLTLGVVMSPEMPAKLKLGLWQKF